MTEATPQGADNPIFAKSGAWLSAHTTQIFTAQDAACQELGVTGS